MNLRPRRHLAAASALAALVSLSACASQAEDPDPPVVTATATPTPTPTLSAAEKTAALCEAGVGLDAANLRLGPPDDEPATAAPTASAEASSSSMDHDMSKMDDDSTAMPTPKYTAAAASTATPDPEPSAGPSAAPSAPAAARPPRPSFSEVMGPAVAALEKAPKIDAVSSDVEKVLTVLNKALATEDRDLLDSDEYVKAGAGLDKYMLANCGYGKLTASAIDFEYDGLPKTLKGGPNSISLTNDGDELHEIVLFRINDGVTQSFEELLELPEEESDGKVVPMAVVVVPPGQTGTSFADLQAGRYGVACFIPKGTKDGKEGDGPPHFTEGMVADLTVT